LLPLLIVFAAACREQTPGYALIGDPARGHLLVGRYGCASCHVIPGASDRGLVGPPLAHMAQRRYVAGHFPNVPQNLIEWIRFPAELKPATAMPDLGVGDRDARDIAAYLYTLR
jgi:cytochrome c1